MRLFGAVGWVSICLAEEGMLSDKRFDPMPVIIGNILAPKSHIISDIDSFFLDFKKVKLSHR